VNSTTLDIIVPCYNPIKGWEKELYTNFTLLKKQLTNINLSLTLINDGSETGINTETISYLESNVTNFNYLKYAINKGKGYALRKGVARSNAEFIIFTDVDFPYQIESIVKVFEELQKGTDAAIGNRDIDYYEKTPFIRALISKTFKSFIKLFLQLKVTDTQCGLKGFNKTGKNEFLSTTINRFLFDLEFVKKCSQNKNISIKAVPVLLKDNVVFSKMDYKILARESVNFLMILLK